MPKQMDMNDLVLNELKAAVRRFVDEQYTRQAEMSALHVVRNRHEGYGLLAEAYLGVKGAVDSVKAAMGDCLKTLAGLDGVFQDAASDAFNALLDTCIAATNMGVQALNVIYSIGAIRAADVTPMEEMAAEAEAPAEDADEIPDVPEEVT